MYTRQKRPVIEKVEIVLKSFYSCLQWRKEKSADDELNCWREKKKKNWDEQIIKLLYMVYRYISRNLSLRDPSETCLTLFCAGFNLSAAASRKVSLNRRNVYKSSIYINIKQRG